MNKLPHLDETEGNRLEAFDHHEANKVILSKVSCIIVDTIDFELDYCYWHRTLVSIALLELCPFRHFIFRIP